MIDEVAKFVFRKSLSGIEKFRNIHKGQTCYIFGDGPSIKWFDLSQFSDYVAICCGILPFHKDFDKLNVKYMTLVEPWFFAPKIFQPKIIHEFKILAAEYKKLIKRSLDKEFFIHLSNIFSLSGKNVNYVFRGLPKTRNQTDELLGQFDLFAGSFRASLTLAYYLGFSKFYLVGFDGWTIQPARDGHWYEFGEGVFFEATNFGGKLLEIFKSEMDIYTISFEGGSKNLKNISYKDFAQTEPQYRENYDLLSAEHIAILSTYPGYRMCPP